MDQEIVHLLGISLEPAIGVVGFAVCAEDVGVAVDDPGVDAENDLYYVNILKVYIYGGGSRTPSGKYLPAMVIPSLGTTRGRLCETPGWKRYASFNYITVRRDIIPKGITYTSLEERQLGSLTILNQR